MGDFWKHIVKPDGPWARWLIFIALVAIAAAGITGNLEPVREHLDTEALTFTAGNFRVSPYDVLRALVLLVLVFCVTASIASGVQHSVHRMTRLHPPTLSLLS